MLVLINHINKATVLTDLFTMIVLAVKQSCLYHFSPKFSASLVGVFFTLEFLCPKTLSNFLKFVLNILIISILSFFCI